MRQPIRLAATRREAEAWMLALASQGIRSWLTRTSEDWVVLVRDADFERARTELDAHDLERGDEPEPTPPPTEYGFGVCSLVVALLLLAFFLVVRSADTPTAWIVRGAASADRIQAGEIWRTVTALTLHLDAPHAIGNAAFFALFGTAVCWSLGPGVGTALILLAGAAGNVLNALLHGSGHHSAGASTAVFGAIGILASLQFTRWRAARPARRKVWLPLGAGLGLLAMLGVSPRADVTAHVLGLVVGTALGAAAGVTLTHPPRRFAQGAWLVTTAATVVWCWMIALA